MQSFDCLVIVYSDPAVFALQVGQLDVVVRCRLIYFHDFHRFVEKGGKDELGIIISSRILKEPLKLDVRPDGIRNNKNEVLIPLWDSVRLFICSKCQPVRVCVYY